MKPISVALLSLFLIAPFAGCLSGGGGSESTDTTQPTTSAGDANTTTPAGNVTANTPPTVAAKILVNGTEVSLVNESYAVPSGQNITFDASESSDAESANLTFSWDFGDGNTSTDAVATYSYAAAGNFSVNLTVRDDAGGESAASFALVVASSGPAPGTVVGEVKKPFSGTITAAVQDPLGQLACGSTNGVGTLHEFAWEIAAAAADGTAVRISKFLLPAPTQGDTAVDVDYYLYDAAGKEIGRSAQFEALDGPEPGFTKEGDWAPGAYKIAVKGCLAVNGSFSGEITATLVAA